MATPQAKRKETATLSAIVTEVLSVVFVPIRLRKILRDACESAGIGGIPESPMALRVFVEGALFSTLVRHLDVSMALELNEQIRSSLALAMSTQYEDGRATQEIPASDVREADRHSGAVAGRRVLVVTEASLVVFLLQDILGDAAEVLPISGENELKDRLRRFGGHPLLVVVDRRHPCVGPRVARLLRTDLSETSAVVWWAASPEEVLDVEAMLLGGPELTSTALALPLADLGEVCVGVIERFSE